jgi:hypothetical protein
VKPTKQTRFPLRLLSSLAAAVTLLLGGTAASRADDSLARCVPADVGLFAEIRGAEDLLTTLTEPQVWTTLAELVGQPAQPQEVDLWRKRIRQTVKMEPEEAIRVLFSRGVAFVGEGLGRTQDAVVLCRPAGDTRELLERWDAQRLSRPAQPPTYRLYSNIAVAEHNGLLFFGDVLRPDGMFKRMQNLVAGRRGQSLADDPAYRKLRDRVPPNPDGILFARLGQAATLLMSPVPPGSQPGTQPSSRPTLRDLPGPLRDAQNVLLALHREGPLLHFTAVGDAPGSERAPRPRPVRLAETLPERTLLAWQARVDFVQLVQSFRQLPQQNPIRGAFQLPEQIESLEAFAAALDTEVCLAVGPVFPGRRPPATPPLPAIALLVGTRDSAAVLREVRNVVNVGMVGYVLFAYQRGLPLLEPIEERQLGRTPVSLLDLSPLLKPVARRGIGEVHLCWAVHEKDLIIASHLDWLRQIIAAREGQAPNLASALRLSRGKPPSGSVNAIVVQSGPIADIGTRWLDYLRRNKPDVFDEAWWRTRQPGGEEVRLGISVTPDSANRRLRIVAVYENQPADGRLEVGDFIVGHGNRRFTSDHFIAEMRTAIRERPHARWFDLLIERDGITGRQRIPLPFINPIEFLQRLAAIGKITQRVVYVDDQSSAAGPRGFLTIELRTGDKPLFDFAPPVPIGSTKNTAN